MMNSAHDRAVASVFVIASLFAGRWANAQEAQQPPNTAPAAPADSLPFRTGQWGAEFAINNGTFGLGVLRFRSPQSAWLLHGSGSASWGERVWPGLGESNSIGVFAQLRAGPRRYRPIATASAAYVGLGLMGSYGRATNADYGLRMWEAGAFGDLGAVYFVTRHLSLGAQVELDAAFSSSRQTSLSQPGIDRDRRFSIGVSPVRILGALYF